MKDIYISDGPVEVNLQEPDYPVTPQPPYTPEPEQQPQKKKRKKHKFIKKLLRTLVIIFIVVTLIISGTAVISGYTRENLKSNSYISFSELNNNPLVTNILLIGTDDSDGSASRSDTMLMVSLDYIHGKIKLTSFLRDCRVEIPSTGKQMKLNAACVYGGPQLVCDTIEYNFRVDIDHYMKVNFEMFTEIIDAIGGIDVEVTKQEADFINRTTRHTVSSGDSVHLNGAEALVYVRIRKLDSDYMRTFRQRKVVTALLSKMKRSSPLTLLRAVKDIMPLIQTDLNAFEIALLAYKAGFAALFFEIQQMKIPEDNMMTTGYVGSQWVEIPDLDACRKGLYEFIYKNKD